MTLKDLRRMYTLAKKKHVASDLTNASTCNTGREALKNDVVFKGIFNGIYRRDGR